MTNKNSKRAAYWDGHRAVLYRFTDFLGVLADSVFSYKVISWIKQILPECL